MPIDVSGPPLACFQPRRFLARQGRLRDTDLNVPVVKLVSPIGGARQVLLQPHCEID